MYAIYIYIYKNGRPFNRCRLIFSRFGKCETITFASVTHRAERAPGARVNWQTIVAMRAIDFCRSCLFICPIMSFLCRAKVNSSFFPLALKLFGGVAKWNPVRPTLRYMLGFFQRKTSLKRSFDCRDDDTREANAYYARFSSICR